MVGAQEAENLRALQQGKTPLLGGENPLLHPSDFSGVTPRRKEAFTPNPLATPLRTPAAGGSTPSVAGTPGRGGAGAGAVARTPLRDELGINDADAVVDMERAALAAARRELREGLSGLPAPRNEYQISVPELPADDCAAADELEEDAADAVSRRAAEAAAATAAELRRRSQVLQRGLPRPLPGVGAPAPQAAGGRALLQAEAALAAELSTLLAHDATRRAPRGGLLLPPIARLHPHCCAVLPPCAALPVH